MWALYKEAHMGYTVDVDIGGTFTDFFAARDSAEVRITKYPTK